MEAETRAGRTVSLEAKSPFEMRVHLGEDVPDTDVRSALKTGDMGFLHSFTTGSAVDGPGIRLVAWTTACMFRCQYCHNPDTWTLSNGIPVTLEQAVEEIRKYANGLKAMDGGFTLSGGEPLMQDRFAARLFAAVKAMGVHTAIETNGFYGDRLSDDELRTIDLVILDMKAFSLERHKEVTGGRDNAGSPGLRPPPAAAEAADVAALRAGPGAHRHSRGNGGAGRFGASLGVVERVEILPFHQLGQYKWERLGLEYQLACNRPADAAGRRRSGGDFPRGRPGSELAPRPPHSCPQF